MTSKHPNVENYVNMLNEEWDRMKNKYNPRPLSLEEEWRAYKQKCNEQQSIAEQFKLKPIPKDKNQNKKRKYGNKKVSPRKLGKSKYG